MMVPGKSLKQILVSSATFILCVLAAPMWNLIHAKDPWQRAYTGDDSIIELNTSTLKFGPDNLLRALTRERKQI
jgi:hypothetical protein